VYHVYPITKYECVSVPWWAATAGQVEITQVRIFWLEYSWCKDFEFNILFLVSSSFTCIDPCGQLLSPCGMISWRVVISSSAAWMSLVSFEQWWHSMLQLGIGNVQRWEFQWRLSGAFSVMCSQVIEMRNSVVKYCLPETEQWISKRKIQLFFTCYWVLAMDGSKRNSSP
jgi:hypothetical protein